MVSPAAAKAIEKVAQKYIEKKGAGGGKGPSSLGGGPFDKLQTRIKIAKEIKGLGGSGGGASAVPSGLKFSGGKSGKGDAALKQMMVKNLGSKLPGIAGKGFELGSKFSNMEGKGLGGGKDGPSSLGDGPKFQQALMKAVKSELGSKLPGGSFKAGMEMGQSLGAAQKKDTTKSGQQGDASKATDQQKDTPTPKDQQKDAPKGTDQQKDVSTPERQKDASKPEERQKDTPIPDQQKDAPKGTDQQKDTPIPEQQGDTSTKPGDQPQEKDTPTTPEEVAAEAAVEEVPTAAQETVEDLTAANVEGDVSGTALDSVEAEYADYNPQEGIVTNTPSIEEDRIEEIREQQETVKELEADAALGLPPDPSQVVEAESLVAIAHEGSALDAELMHQSQNPALDASNASQISEGTPQEVQTATQETVENLTAGSLEGDVVVAPDSVEAAEADYKPQEGIVVNPQSAEEARIEEIQEQQVQFIEELEAKATVGIDPDVDTVTLSQTGETTATQLGEVVPESATVADQEVTPENNPVSHQNAPLETQSSNQGTAQENSTTGSRETLPETIQEVSTAGSQEAIVENQIVANQDTKFPGEQPVSDTDVNLQRSKEERSIAQGDNATSETAAKGQEDTGLYIEFTDVKFLGRSGQTASELTPQAKQEAGRIDATTGKQQSEPSDANVVTDNQQARSEDAPVTSEIDNAMKYEQFQRQIEELQANFQRQIAELKEQFQKEKGEGGEQTPGKGNNPVTDAVKKAMEKGRGSARKVASSLFADTGEEAE